MKRPSSHRYKKAALCIFEACGHPKRSGGLCAVHFAQKKAGVELQAIQPTKTMHVQTSRITDDAKVVLEAVARERKVTPYEITSSILEEVLSRHAYASRFLAKGAK